jgi:putative addiction module killer protein
MRKIRQTSVYTRWFETLRDAGAKYRIMTRIQRLADGNPGNNRFLGDICELKIDYGPGYRVYYKDTGKEIIILLCDGDKSAQKEDIAKARELAKMPLPEEEEN